MLQYIINTTAIWLVGLIVFDLFLRNEANHGYNRFYLLAILFAGTLIPLWSWDHDSVIYSTGVSRPIAEQSAEVRQTIVAASESTVLGWEQWLMIVYATGAGIFSLLLLRDVLSIIRLYRQGKKSKDGIWTVIETGKHQSPFSAFRYVFISRKDNYTQDELNMILAHEEQHGHMLHFIDVLLIRVANILFWFNPLIYIIEKRLLLVHEYQADKAVTNNPSTYGKFLVEQSVLSSAPVLAHSFIRSPLKKRILMLTKKTTTLAKGKQLLLLPVLAIAILSFTENAFFDDSPQRDGNKVTYRGNVVEFGNPGKPDTTEVYNSETGEPAIVITTRDPAPIKLNGELIYRQPERGDNPDYINVATKGTDLTAEVLKKYLLENLKNEYKKLGDGEYYLGVQFIVLNEKGKVVYYETYNITKEIEKEGKQSRVALEEDTKNRLLKKISKLMNRLPAYEPATKDGKNVSIMIDNEAFYSSFSIKDGKVTSL